MDNVRRKKFDDKLYPDPEFMNTREKRDRLHERLTRRSEPFIVAFETAMRKAHTRSSVAFP